MSFGGSFKDHILPDKAHVISVSFLLDALVQQRGGVGGNIAYTLALLGEPSALVGTVGRDFGEYREAFEHLGIDLTNVVTLDDELTSSSFMNADMAGNQIAAFYPGAGGRSAELDVTEAARAARFGIVGAGAPDAMRKHAAEIVAAGCSLIFDPSQQIVILTGDDLQAGIDAADIVIGNDYEFGMMERKTGLTVADIAARVRMAVVTYGDRGSEIFTGGEVVAIPIATPEQVADPTGGGDAYRAGFIKGLLHSAELPVVGRMAALAATYAIERHGPQEHQFSAVEFVARFDGAFPDHAGVLSAGDLATNLATADMT